MKKYLNKIIKLLNDKKGFTLIEMLLVLLVVALLMAIIIPNVSGQRERINQQAAENIKDIVETQVNTYILVENDDPASLDVLVNEGYLTNKQKNEAEKFLSINSLSQNNIQIKSEFIKK